MALFLVIFLHLSNVLGALGGKQRSPGGCPLPEKPANGNYEVTDCEEGDFSSKCRKIPGIIVSNNVIIEYTCNPGYVLSENINHSFCRRGTWNPDPPSCLKLCKEVYSDSLDLECYYRGHKVDCGRPLRPKTELIAKCKLNYKIDDPSISFSSIQCLPDGKWESELFKCVPDCGIRNPINNVTTTISGGRKANQSEYPWHAGLFETEGEEFVYLCGGTIIHPKAVLTAAHCVYNDNTNSKKDEKKLRVAVGKSYSSWNAREPNEQKFVVAKIILQDKYVGLKNKFEQDIAILHLDRNIVFHSAVMPICFDKDERLSLYKGSDAVGTVVGLGANKIGGERSVELRAASFSFLGFKDCRKQVSHSHYVTYDKFCTGLSNGTSLQRWDDGGGLTFPKFANGLEQHFIYGIFSLPPTGNGIFAFTNITEHKEWIDAVLKNL